MTRFPISRLAGRAGPAILAGLAALPACAQNLGLGGSSPEIPLWRVVGALFFCCLLGAVGALALRYRLRNRAGRAPRANMRLVDEQTVGRLMAALGLKGPKGEAAPTRLQLIETVRLSYQVEVSLVECDGVGVMIVTSPHGAFVVNRDAPTKTGSAS